MKMNNTTHKNNLKKSDIDASNKGMQQDLVYLIIGAAILIGAFIYYASTTHMFCKLPGIC